MHNSEDTQTADRETWSGNLFTDLGLEDADELYTRTALGIQVMKTIREKGLRQKESGKLLGLKQRDVSAIMRAKFSRFSQECLMGFLNKLEQNVTIHVSRTNRLWSRDEATPITHEGVCGRLRV